MSERRTLCWFSSGAASAVATKLTLRDGGSVVVANCDTHSEHPDNERFLKDCEVWFAVTVSRISSEKYADTWDVWARERYLAGIDGARCTKALKIIPRLAYQRPDDIHVFGYTADKSDAARAERLRANYPELTIQTPLIERDLDKAACLALVKAAGIELPVTYAQGFPNANCLPCVKATSPAYWALVRLHYPDRFRRMVTLSRELDVRLTRIKGERAFIDEIPADHPTTKAIVPSCDFLCSLIENELDEVAA